MSSRIGNYFFNLCIYITYLVSFLPLLIFNKKTYYVFDYNKNIDLSGVIIYILVVLFFIKFIPVISSYLKRYFLLISNQAYRTFGFLEKPYIKITFSNPYNNNSHSIIYFWLWCSTYGGSKYK